MDPNTPGAEQTTWSERFRRQDMLIATLAVTVIAVAALAAVLTARHTEERFRQSSPDASAVATAPAGASSSTPQDVVQAPPLADPSKRATRNPTSTMGAAPALCRSCGVVESVVAVQGTTRGKTQAVGFLMNIRMDDGSARTVEQRGALAAGSRVMVEGETVRTMKPSAGS